MHLKKIQQLITETELACGRKPGSVRLLAVSKSQTIAAITEIFNQGLTHFGENYYQEALTKIESLKHLPIHWHFIGPIQSNKTKGIATHFDWVHSISRAKIAQQLNEQRPTDFPPLNVCIQINLLEEQSKSGVRLEQARELAEFILKLPKLKLRGLMILPPPPKNQEEQYAIFMQLNELMDTLNQQLNCQMDTLSMGMSADFIPAIKAGSTIVRVGRAIFGERQG